MKTRCFIAAISTSHVSSSNPHLRCGLNFRCRDEGYVSTHGHELEAEREPLECVERQVPPGPEQRGVPDEAHDVRAEGEQLGPMWPMREMSMCDVNSTIASHSTLTNEDTCISGPLPPSSSKYLKRST